MPPSETWRDAFVVQREKNNGCRLLSALCQLGYTCGGKERKSAGLSVQEKGLLSAPSGRSSLSMIGSAVVEALETIASTIDTHHRRRYCKCAPFQALGHSHPSYPSNVSRAPFPNCTGHVRTENRRGSTTTGHTRSTVPKPKNAPRQPSPSIAFRPRNEPCA